MNNLVARNFYVDENKNVYKQKHPSFGKIHAIIDR